MARGTPDTTKGAKKIRRQIADGNPDYTLLAEDLVGMDSQDAYMAFEKMAADTPTKTPEEKRR